MPTAVAETAIAAAITEAKIFLPNLFFSIDILLKIEKVKVNG
jgi:hypothetical protein